MVAFLEALGLNPIGWPQAVKGSGRPVVHISDILTSAFTSAQAILVLLTGDDEGRLRERFQRPGDPTYETEETPQPRLNVVFEAGMAIGRDPKRTVLVQLGKKMRPFSDISGIHVLRFTGTAEDREMLRTKLEQAGCAIRARRDWLKAGDFSRPIHDD